MELKRIEDWSFTRFKEVLFDSDINNWSCNNSSFTNKLQGKDHIVINIETDNGIQFGVYINKTIDEIEKEIEDENMFLFTFRKRATKNIQLQIVKMEHLY